MLFCKSVCAQRIGFAREPQRRAFRTSQGERIQKKAPYCLQAIGAMARRIADSRVGEL
jgi:hypothetical protein